MKIRISEQTNIGGSSNDISGYDQRLKKIEQMLGTMLQFERALLDVGQLEKRIEHIENGVDAFESRIKEWDLERHIMEQNPQQQQQMHDNPTFGRQSMDNSIRTIINKNSIIMKPRSTNTEIGQGYGKMPVYDMTPQHVGRGKTVAQLIAEVQANSSQDLLAEIQHRPEQRDALNMTSNHLPSEINQRLESQRSGPSNLGQQMDELWDESSNEDKR
ncbi:hypothetical protein niasHT_023052 [Heterodera trifolii]|uniref:Uncharacterized protein n=1 Tax=Heterodera trifolii TaxID=157864 RepID=A0ABD2KFF3_9BILA